MLGFVAQAPKYTATDTLILWNFAQPPALEFFQHVASVCGYFSYSESIGVLRTGVAAFEYGAVGVLI